MDAFTRLLLSHASDPPSSSLPPLLRTLILPLHDFDHKWRTIVPAIINPTPPEIKEKDLSRVKLTQRERDGLQAFFVAWKIKAEEKLKSDKSKAVDKSASAVKAEDSSGASKPSPREEEGSASMQVDVVVVEEKDKPAAWTVQEVDVSEWLNERELFE